MEDTTSNTANRKSTEYMQRSVSASLQSDGKTYDEKPGNNQRCN